MLQGGGSLVQVQSGDVANWGNWRRDVDTGNEMVFTFLFMSMLVVFGDMD
jgi:hypothetical protein